MSRVSKSVIKSGSDLTCGGRRRGRLHNFESATRWVVRPDGESYGSDTRSHDALARSAGYKNADQAYANGALMAHYEPTTDALRIEVKKATSKEIALARQIINRVPAVLAHVSIGSGENFRSYMGRPREVAAHISRIHLVPPVSGLCPLRERCAFFSTSDCPVHL